MSTYNAIRYNVDYAKAGSLKLLSTQTASASASISFTTGIDSTYDEYWFIFNNIHPESNDITFQFQVDTGTNTNYNQTITSTSFFSYHREDDVSGLSYSTGGDQAQGTSFQNISDSVGNENDEAVSGWLRLFEPSSGTFVKHFMACSIANMHSEGAYNPFRGGYINTTTAITRVQFKMSSGNIDDGTIQLFGVKQ
jgi:hypothetical protein